MRSARANKVKLLGLSQTLLRLDKSQQNARDKLYIKAIDELTFVGVSILQKYKILFNKITKTSNTAEYNQFANLVREIEHAYIREPGYDIIMHLFRIHEDCKTLVERYKSSDTPIGKLLAANGSATLEAAFYEILRKAMERLNETVYTYLKSFPKSELQKETKIMRWLERSKNEPHADKKLGILMEFFVTYDQNDI